MVERTLPHDEIAQNPRVLDEEISQVERSLSSMDGDRRSAAAETLRKVAEQDPTVVEQYADLVLEHVADESEVVQLQLLIALAEITEKTSTTPTGFVKELTTLLRETDSPQIQLAVVRVLAAIGTTRPGHVESADETVGALLETAPESTRDSIVGMFGPVVVQEPGRFPRTVHALEHCLDAASPDLRLYAATTLALAAREDPSTISRPADVLAQVAKLREDDRVPQEKAERAERLLQASLSNGGRA